MKLNSTFLAAGEETHVPSLHQRAVAEFPEFTWNGSEAAALLRTLDATRDHECIEVVAWEADVPVGMIVLVLDNDMHVGRCLSVLWNYVLPEARSYGIQRQFIREALAVARQVNAPVLAYTHRRDVGRYELKYRRVDGKGNQESP